MGEHDEVDTGQEEVNVIVRGSTRRTGRSSRLRPAFE